MREMIVVSGRDSVDKLRYLFDEGYR